MINLASLRYRNVMAEAGGPVARIELFDTETLGQREFLANAFLREDLAGETWRCQVFSTANGSGTAQSPMVARYMAISEAMERWAHWQMHVSADRAAYGFDVDPSTNGMAAFPGLWRRQAQAGAVMEAAERFNLLNWWEGRLPAAEASTQWPGVRSATICSDAPGVTVILFKHATNGFFAYGHGSATNYKSACRKAAVEMERHACVVARFAVSHAGRLVDQLPPDAHPLERRSLFFATESGHELFLERLRSAPTKPAPRLREVFNGPVPGPWSKYADVWRTVYEPPSDRFLGPEENYFMW